MIRLDALQVVALEEGISTDEQDYPSGAAFWTAVDPLRERGAHVPDYESASAASEGGSGDDGALSSASDTAATPGAEATDPALAHEAELLRETVTDQRARRRKREQRGVQRHEH